MEIEFKPKDTKMKTHKIRGFMVVVKNVDGEPYIIDGEYIKDLVDDWNGDAVSCPANDERVLFFMYNWEVVNPYEYTDFESVIRWMRLKLGEEIPF